MTLRKLKTCTRDVDEKLRVPETFYMLLDMDRGTLAFQVIFEKHNDISRQGGIKWGNRGSGILDSEGSHR